MNFWPNPSGNTVVPAIGQAKHMNQTIIVMVLVINHYVNRFAAL